VPTRCVGRRVAAFDDGRSRVARLRLADQRRARPASRQRLGEGSAVSSARSDREGSKRRPGKRHERRQEERPTHGRARPATDRSRRGPWRRPGGHGQAGKTRAAASDSTGTEVTSCGESSTGDHRQPEARFAVIGADALELRSSAGVARTPKSAIARRRPRVKSGGGRRVLTAALHRQRQGSMRCGAAMLTPTARAPPRARNAHRQRPEPPAAPWSCWKRRGQGEESVPAPSVRRTRRRSSEAQNTASHQQCKTCGTPLQRSIADNPAPPRQPRTNVRAGPQVGHCLEIG